MVLQLPAKVAPDALVVVLPKHPHRRWRLFRPGISVLALSSPHLIKKNWPSVCGGIFCQRARMRPPDALLFCPNRVMHIFGTPLCGHSAICSVIITPMERSIPQFLAWYRQPARTLVWRAPFGQFPDPYHVWVSEIILQQTQVATVTQYFLRWIARFPNIADFFQRQQISQCAAFMGRVRLLCASA